MIRALLGFRTNQSIFPRRNLSLQPPAKKSPQLTGTPLASYWILNCLKYSIVSRSFQRSPSELRCHRHRLSSPFGCVASFEAAVYLLPPEVRVGPLGLAYCGRHRKSDPHTGQVTQNAPFCPFRPASFFVSTSVCVRSAHIPRNIFPLSVSPCRNYNKAGSPFPVQTFTIAAATR